MATSNVPRSPDRSRSAWVILLCFFASGFSGLVYQVIWVRELVLVFGATTFAVSTVLTVFMGGLAAGSFYFGRRSEKITRPLRLYGLLEIGIGLYGLAVPMIFALLPGLYHALWGPLQVSFIALSAVRFLFAALVLIVPTALMGATLPVLSGYYARDIKRLGLRVGALYSLNTFGAVLGASATGFILIPALGMKASTLTAAVINILLGLASIHLSRKHETVGEVQLVERPVRSKESRTYVLSLFRARKDADTSKQKIAVPVPASPQEVVAVLAAFAVSGFIALSYEVIWSRVLALIIGSSVYAFSIMLTTFLIGLALGASLISRVVDRIRRPIMAFAIIEIGVGVTSIAGAYLFDDLPFIFVQLYRIFENSALGLLLFARFFIASLVMIAPTLLLGAIFPLVVRICASARQLPSGRTVGDAYAANTIGAIAGSFASGFILVPWLGLLGSLRLAAALNFAIAAALFAVTWRARQSKSKPRRAPLWGVAASLLLMIGVAATEPPWDADAMSSAVYRYAPSLVKMSRQEFNDFLRRGQGETVFYKEGVTATIAVQKQGRNLVLKANGKPEASTAGDMPTQILIGSLPLLVRKQTDDVLVIGLGSGITLGSVEQFAVKRVTCVELEPAMIEASRHFENFNHRPLEDARLRMVANDGRNFIYTTNEKFDVIVSEPSNPWLTGVANLFTLEYFKRGADRLTDDGLFSQWLQIYEMSPEDVRTLIGTFRAAFPYVYLFRGAEGDLMLLGSKRQQQIDLSIIDSNLKDEKVAADLARVDIRSVADLVSRFYLGSAEVDLFAQASQINTDDNALIEFSAPRRVGSTEETVLRNVNQLLDYAVSPLKYTEGLGADARYEADFLVKAALAAVKRQDYGRAEHFVNYSLELAETASARGMQGELRLARKDEAGAVESWQRALALDAKHFYTLIDMGRYYLTKQDIPRAAALLDRAIEVDPASARARHLRGLAYQADGDHSRAAVEYRKALPDVEYTRSIKTFYLNFGTALIQTALYEEAAQMLEEYTRLAPNDSDGHFQLGVAYEVISSRTLDDRMTERAIDELKLALSIKRDYPLAHYYLSKAYRRLGMIDEANAEFELYERLSP
jgi:spermidine synthase